MKCPTCVEEGKKSRVTTGHGSTTLMGFTPYYDEDGVYHSHDANRETLQNLCSQGHAGKLIAAKSCPGCDWGSPAEVIKE